MRRMIFRLAAALSAVLWVATCVLWVRSDRVGEELRYEQSWTSPEPSGGRYTLTNWVMILKSAAGTLRVGCGQDQWGGGFSAGLPRGWVCRPSPWGYTWGRRPRMEGMTPGGTGGGGFPRVFP